MKNKTAVTSSSSNLQFILLSVLVLIAILLAYSNHFTNDFQFDDKHTIVDNLSIREVNIGRFFKDGTTLSTRPSNQSYRPYLTTENAIDYALGGHKGESTSFHIHVFITFILVSLLLGLFVKLFLDKIKFSDNNHYWGLLVASIFGLLTANAETVNYVFQRAEIDSGLFILAGLIAYLKGGMWKKYHLYLLFPFIGFFAKEMTFVFAPLLLLYVLIFEENMDLLHFYKGIEFKKLISGLSKSLPAILITFVFFAFYKKMIPTSWSSGGENITNFQYFITQPLVICRYLVTYFVPYNLSADTDWIAFTSLLNYKVIIGFVLLAALLYVALRTSAKKDTLLFSFGLLWFFIALLPTSSFKKYSEVLSDHRCFIPYIGLTIAFVFGMNYILKKYFATWIKQRSSVITIMVLLVIFLGANAYSIHERNKAWKTEKSLWYDVTLKSPKNGRAFMNYGIFLMGERDYINAETNFIKAQSLLPNYSYIYLNLALLKEWTGDNVAADNYFKTAISYPLNGDQSACFYARFLFRQKRYNEAKYNITKALAISPNYYYAKSLSMEIYHNMEDFESLKTTAEGILKTMPDNVEATKYLSYASNRQSVEMIYENEIKKEPTPEKYLDLSLKYYQKNKFEKCIDAANEALLLKSDYPDALNNIGIAYFNLKQYDKAIDAYNKALNIRPDYQLAKNNLVAVQNEVLADKKLEMDAKNNPTPEKYLALSVKYYQLNDFKKCIDAANKALELKKDYSEAYNNIGIANYQLNNYDKAVQAYKKALSINPNNQLAKNNMALALSKMNN